MSIPSSHPNPHLHVGPDLKQGWNRPENRRSGFHNTHHIFRRTLSIRSRRTLDLQDKASGKLAILADELALTSQPGFSALVVAVGNKVLLARAADDFSVSQPHSIQSITKMHMHLIAGHLLAAGKLKLTASAGDYLPELGSGYCRATVRDLLDMNVSNDFSEDYSDPAADCYREEEALGWRLPADDCREMTLLEFVSGITKDKRSQHTGFVDYKSANTDVLTLIAARLMDLTGFLTEICDAAGYEGAFHISLSPEGLPALSGGGSLSALDLARFGLLFARNGIGISGQQIGSPSFMEECIANRQRPLSRLRSWQSYAGHLMIGTNTIGHAGYGGQYLLINKTTGCVAVYLGVIENESGYDERQMATIVRALEQLTA